MSKTKRQLRAEAVERLKKYHDWEPSQKSLNNVTLPIWPMSVDMSNDQRIDALIDLLTDDELIVRNEASDDELFRCSYCHCKVYNIEMTEGDCGWGLTFCPQCGGEVDEHDSRKIEAELGGPTNGTDGETDGIRADAPLVHEPPDSYGLRGPVRGYVR